MLAVLPQPVSDPAPAIALAVAAWRKLDDDAVDGIIRFRRDDGHIHGHEEENCFQGVKGGIKGGGNRPPKIRKSPTKKFPIFILTLARLSTISEITEVKPPKLGFRYYNDEEIHRWSTIA